MRHESCRHCEPETDPFFDPNFTEERAALQERLNVYLEYVTSS